MLTPPDFPSGERWFVWLEQHGAATPVSRRAGTGLSGEDRRWFTTYGISLIVPMMDAGDIWWERCCSPQKSSKPYSAGICGCCMPA